MFRPITNSIDVSQARLWQKIRLGITTAVLLAASLSPVFHTARAEYVFQPRAQLSSSPGAGFEDFRLMVMNGQAEQVVGVFVPGVLAQPIIQQPDSQPGFVSSQPGAITQFLMAADYDTIGLLAHNYLAGAEFSRLEVDQPVFIVYGDGHYDAYKIVRMDRFQALMPNSAYSDFIDLENSSVVSSASEVFYRIYGQGDRVVFQTCIENNGDLSWGRLFVTAEPASTPVVSNPLLVTPLFSLN